MVYCLVPAVLRFGKPAVWWWGSISRRGGRWQRWLSCAGQASVFWFSLYSTNMQWGQYYSFLFPMPPSTGQPVVEIRWNTNAPYIFQEPRLEARPTGTSLLVHPLLLPRPILQICQSLSSAERCHLSHKAEEAEGQTWPGKEGGKISIDISRPFYTKKSLRASDTHIVGAFSSWNLHTSFLLGKLFIIEFMWNKRAHGQSYCINMFSYPLTV